MRKLLFLSILGGSTICSFAEPLVDDNIFVFDLGTGVTDINYEYNEEYETGSDFLTVKNLYRCGPIGGNHKCIDVSTNRKGSSSVADDWNKLLNHNALAMEVIGAGSATGLPDKLNFYIVGTLTINGEAITDNVLLGQGHTGIKNPWWVGNKQGYLGKRGLYVKTSSNKEYYIKGAGHGATSEIIIEASNP